MKKKELELKGADYLQRFGTLIFDGDQKEIMLLVKEKKDAALLEFYGLQSVYESYDKDLGLPEIQDLMREKYGKHKIEDFFSKQNEKFKINIEFW